MPSSKPSSIALFRNGGTLYQYTGEEGNRPHYDPLGDVDDFTITIERRRTVGTDPDEYFIVVLEKEEVVLTQPIGVELQLSYSDQAASVHWSALIDGELETVAFRFTAPVDKAEQVTPTMCVQRFVTLYNQCTYSLLTGYEVDPDDEWYQYLSGATSSKIDNEDVSEPVFELDHKNMMVADTGAGNISAVDSLHFNRMLVIKNDGDSLTLNALPVTEHGFDQRRMEDVVVKTVDNTVTGSLLENGDLKLLLFGGESNAVQQLDLVSGTVVQEYRPENVGIKSLSYANHTSADSGSVYTCLDRNVAFNIDTRMNPRTFVVTESGKQPSEYALSSLSNDFTCHATSRNGYLVIGDGSGNIRLYTGPPGARKPAGGFFPKRAKTLLEVRTPVLDIDVTADGNYIVATTAKLLYLIETRYIEDNVTETNGFQGRMGAKKPAPIALQPSTSQIMEMGGAGAVCFRSAKFDRFPGTEELCVTTCLGNRILVWSMRNILASRANGRSVVNAAVTVGQPVLSTSAHHSNLVTFLTDEDVGMVPLHEVQKKVSRAWSWGQTE
ncbi:hypothetical protein ABL78_6992 [Leptomonas seymouri]|uniref:Vacuolar import/degradation Vid27 C-terminal domain-containing protein n=1 Tax=Leptomonas seymouri TaxID=5684 RepID=A0A0N1HUK8_LEPSE|nr:hypothetical protein ABL78_6992 [Leptomonas seymouri]|eukprot:KPI83961.1 hypothetical protein ABL78_6992 [Leptomonas seymouri]